MAPLATLTPPAALEPLLRAAADPSAAAQGVSTSGVAVVGLPCSLLPAELMHAFGLHPWRIVVRPTPPLCAPSVLQTFCCTWVQALLDQALDGTLAHLWGLILPCNTCDSLQNLPDIWRRTVRAPQRLCSLRLPARVDTPAAIDLLRAELAATCAWLEEQTGAPLDVARLIESARIFNRVRAALRRLHALAGRGVIPYSWLLGAATAVEVLDRRQAAAALEASLLELEARDGRDDDAVRLVLVGGLLDDLRLPRWLEEHGAAIVGDDTCSGARTFEEAADLDERDPLADLAARVVRRAACPVRSASGSERASALLALVAARRAQGVILLPYRGCDPHAFDDVLLVEALARRSIPQLTLEIDPQLGAWGQLTTRLEAFLEIFADLGGAGVDRG
jgi:benzoyl-CoA reductase/2-hydroxyglutaryl-CoA dehydratase subunit BcrC/BadD/HgdB